MVITAPYDSGTHWLTSAVKPWWKTSHGSRPSTARTIRPIVKP